jgi:uncharacterized membrane protein
MKLKYTKFQKIIELITVILLFSIVIYLIASWDNLPNKIPGHYNGAGIVDRWGSKNELLITPIISIVLYTLLTTVSLFPAIWNVPVKTTEKNKKDVYLNTKSMLILVKMEIIIVFSYIVYSDINTQYLGTWFIPIFIIILLGTIIYYITKVCKIKN